MIRRVLVPAVLAGAFLAIATPAHAGPCEPRECPVVKDVCPDNVCVEFWDCLPYVLRCG